jgi:hypothetical protein
MEHKLYCRVDKSYSKGPIMGHMNPAHILEPLILKPT